MSDTKCARLLVEAAEKDLSALRHMDNADAFPDEIFGLHAQQAAEKLFKAWLALLDETYPLVHDLRRLLEMLTAHEPDAHRFGALIEYTPYAVQFRYTGQDMPAGSLDRERIVEEMSELLEEVRRRINGETPDSRPQV